MTEETTQTDGQKTVVAFVAGLLVGGLLVWIFNDTPAEAPVTGTDADTDLRGAGPANGPDLPFEGVFVQQDGWTGDGCRKRCRTGTRGDCSGRSGPPDGGGR